MEGAIAVNPRALVDFTGDAAFHRLRTSGRRREAIARAAGFTGGATPSVVDATAGLGRDAFVLAALGSQVTLIERSPAMHAELDAALTRALGDPEVAAVAARMTLMHGDSRTILAGLHADVVLVDPMHPPRRKSALVKQEMRITRELVGDDPDALETLRAAIACARKRVVLKWPAREDLPLGWPRPSHAIPGKVVRFDVFMISPGAASVSAP